MSKFLCTPCATALTNDDMSAIMNVSCPPPYPEQYVDAFNERWGNVIIEPEALETGQFEKCEMCKYAVHAVHAFAPIGKVTA